MKKIEKLNSFRGFTFIGLLANSLFILFIIVTMIYYANYIRTGTIIPIVEGIAYSIEVMGFVLMLVSIVGYSVKLRFRLPLKIAMSIYFLTEFIFMICDFNLIDVSEFYSPASKAVIIGHCIFSAAISMFYMQLDSDKKCLQIAVSVTAVIMMLASFAIVYNVRVYASILVNSFAYIVLYSSILFFDKREMIYANCHGDIAKVYEESDFFNDNN